MSRPYLPSNQPKPAPVFPSIPIGSYPVTNGVTVDQLWKDHARTRAY
jgi:hypothetical protein